MTVDLSALFPDVRQLSDGWSLYVTQQGEWHGPSDRPLDVASIPAPVPGTVAEALENAGQFDRTTALSLDDKDVWYSCAFGAVAGPARLQFDGLATVADIFVNGEKVLASSSMFVAQSVDVDLVAVNRLDICFRALGPVLAQKQPRARWRPQMIVPPTVRGVRTTVLGRMPGWCPEIHVVGPYRPVTIIAVNPDAIHDVQISSQLDVDGTGHLSVCLHTSIDLSGAEISAAGGVAPLKQGGAGTWLANLAIPAVAPWWPQTHGKPVLHDIHLCIGQEKPVKIGRTGFRRIEVSRGDDGQDFALSVNGVEVFCRGAVWTNADIVRLPGARSDYEPWLTLCAEAHFNMVRIGGTMTYETKAFFDLCDELGLMVWQDAMLANFDYAAGDAAFVAKLETEIRQLLEMTSSSPSFAVFCGGSEMYQQAAMLGLPQSLWAGPITEDILPGIVNAIRKDLVYVPNSPSQGAMPFSPNAGVTHYYGVGAYCRPLDDARRANVRFSAESLAFAHIPEQVTLDTHLPVQPVHDPRWKARVPRDRGASWDFEDIRDHYLQVLYGLDPNRLRREDPQTYLHLSRAVTGEVLEATYAEWRRTGSSCHGALTFTLQDLLPGAGWGAIDSTGLPKPVWHALRRAFRPVQVVLTDEGTNGLDVHVINEQPDALDAVLEVQCLREGATPVVRGQKNLTLAPQSTQKFAATQLFGAFFDTTYAFRFGPPAHDVTVAILKAADGSVLATAYDFPQGRTAAFGPATLTATLRQEQTGWWLDLETSRLVQNVSISAAGYLPSDNWFHLAPGAVRQVHLKHFGAQPDVATPHGEILVLGSKTAVRF